MLLLVELFSVFFLRFASAASFAALAKRDTTLLLIPLGFFSSFLVDASDGFLVSGTFFVRVLFLGIVLVVFRSLEEVAMGNVEVDLRLLSVV